MACGTDSIGKSERIEQRPLRRGTADYGRGYSVDNLEFFRLFFLEYNSLLGSEKSDALRRISITTDISDAVRRKSMESNTVLFPQGQHAPRSQSWQPGQFHPNLSWTHYRTLLRVEKTGARAFYEIEAIRNNWSARTSRRRFSPAAKNYICNGSRASGGTTA